MRSIVIPSVGATGGDVRIVRWCAAPGASVAAGDVLLLVETDKATVEVPAFAAGVLAEILLPEGAACPPGTVVGRLAVNDGETVPWTAKGASEGSPGDRPRDAVRRPLGAYATMVLIRRYDDHLYRLFLEGLVPGTLHQCQGQEAVAVGVCSALRTDDLVSPTHRPVGHAIAKVRRCRRSPPRSGAA